MWGKIKTYFRKHDFDLNNNEIVSIDFDNGKSFKFPRYTCKKCGKKLCLDLWQMKQLPWDMARGCPGKKSI